MRRTTKSAVALAAALAFAPAAHATQLTEEQLNNVDGLFRSNDVLTEWAIDTAAQAVRSEGKVIADRLTSRDAFNILYQKDLIDTPGMNRMDACTNVRLEKKLEDAILNSAIKALQNEHQPVPEEISVGRATGRAFLILNERGIALDVILEARDKNKRPIADACYQDYRAKTPFWPSDLKK